ncbi:hypothetical protein B0H14DRAFT_2779872 [Mycena olivaceomarginata]|nr:hypothetical protein B0H14DRAFT_2779872 [Mycena olivaceomarginata]
MIEVIDWLAYPRQKKIQAKSKQDVSGYPRRTSRIDGRQMARPGFCCVSSKALQNIFKYLSRHEITRVCSLCRRLNRLSVNILLAANGILDPTVKCHVQLGGISHIDSEVDVLTALQYALFIPSMTHFSMTFTRTFATIRLARNMKRCERVLHKFPSIRDAEYDARFLAGGGLKYPSNTEFRALLDATQNLPSLELLRVATGWDFDSNYMLELFPCVVELHPSPPRVTSLLERAHKMCREMFPRLRPPSLPPRTPITFLIDTPILVLPSFYAWTISVLSCRSVTVLRLHMLIAADDWVIILREMAAALHCLAELTILGVRMPVPALIRSVSQFRGLKKLTTDSTTDFFTQPSFRAIAPAPDSGARGSRRFESPFSSACLANLTELATRPEHLGVLLRARALLPALASLCVRVELLDLNSPGIAPLMCTVLRRLRRSHRSLPVMLDVRANISPEAMMCRTLDIALARGDEWDEAFGTITHLRVRDYGAHNCLVLARWTTVFRGATDVLLAGISGSQASLIRTAAEIRRTCPNVRTVTVEGMVEPPAETHTEIAEDTGGFLGLPDDVLLNVFERLRSAELYGLSRLSRRLNLLSLPVYLAHEGIPDANQLCDFRLVNHPTAADVLSALNSALFLREIKHISCRFKPGGYLSCYIRNIQRLTAFLAKFPSVETVSLTLVELGNIDDEINVAVQTKWRVTFGKLLDVILEKSCGEVTITGPPYIQSSTSESPWPRDEPTLELFPVARANFSALRSLSFHRAADSSHSGILWPFSTLRCSQITRLSITAVSSSLLEVIAQELPTLPELDVAWCPEILEAKLLALLCKLTCLIYLALPLPQKECDVPAFSSLRRLAAPAPFIIHFLTAAIPLPALERLEIRASSSWLSTLIPSVTKAIRALVEREPNVPVPMVVLDLTVAPEHAAATGSIEYIFLAPLAAKFVRGLNVRGLRRTYLGRLDGNVLGPLIPYFPALHELSVDNGTRRRMAGGEMCPEMKHT